MARKQYIETMAAKSDIQINGVSVMSSGSLPNVFYKDIDTSDDITEGTTNLFMTSTQETNFETAYSHSQITTGNPHNLSSLDLTDGDDLFNKVTDDMDDILDGTTYVKTQNDFNDAYKDKLDSLEDIWTNDGTNVKMKPLNLKDLSLQDYDINDVKAIQMKTDSANPTHSEGKVFYDMTKKALSYYNENSDVTVSLGQELLIRVKNETGSTIVNGSVVYPSGVSGSDILVGLANCIYFEKSRLLGLATTDIPNNSYGYVCKFGVVGDVDTSSFSAGDFIYVSDTVDGGLINTQPSDETFISQIGVVKKVGTTDGEIIVDINTSELTVESTDTNGFPTSQRNGTTIAFNNTSRYFTLSSSSGSFNYYENGIKYKQIGDADVQITDVEGIHAIYFDDGTLSSLANPTDSQIVNLILNKPLVAYVYWNATDKTAIYIADERHGISMSPATHLNLHFTRGCQFLNGYGLNDFSVDGNGNDNVHAQFSIAGGMIADEDIMTSFTGVGSTTGLPIYYLLGSVPNLRRVVNSGYSVYGETGGRLYYNQNIGGNWQLTQAGNGNYVLCHVFAVNGADGYDKVIAVMGQNEYTSMSTARIGATTEVSNVLLLLQEEEKVLIGTIIFQTKDDFNNAVKARIVSTDTGSAYVDWRTSANPSSHDNLMNVKQVGVGVVQGHLSDVAETIYGVKTFNDGLITPTITDTFNIETKVLDITDYTIYDNVKYTFFISDGTNMRNGTLYILCNGTTSYLSESSGASVGNTDAVTFEADLSVNDIQLKVTSTTTGWTIKLKKEMQW